MDDTDRRLIALLRADARAPVAGLARALKVSRGTVQLPSARPLHAIKGYRVLFDLEPTDESVEPINMRVFLRANGQPLTETWLYQWSPPPLAERKPA